MPKDTTPHIKRAARLSHKHEGDTICKRLGISRITLKRYIRSPHWTEFGGTTRPLFPKASGAKGGRPKSTGELTAKEKRTLQKVETLKVQGLNYKQIAARLKITRDQLFYLRKKGGDLQ